MVLKGGAFFDVHNRRENTVKIHYLRIISELFYLGDQLTSQDHFAVFSYLQARKASYARIRRCCCSADLSALFNRALSNETEMKEANYV